MSLCNTCPAAGKCFFTHTLKAEVLRWGEFGRTIDVSVNKCSIYDATTVRGFAQGAKVQVLYKDEWRPGVVQNPPERQRDGDYVEIALDDQTCVAFSIQSGRVRLEAA